MEKQNIKEAVYSVKGMHCASCEILIEKKLLEIKGIKSVETKSGKEEVVIEYSEAKPSANYLNNIFQKDNYFFSEKVAGRTNNATEIKANMFSVLLVSVFLIGGFLYLNRIGISGLVNLDSNSSLPAFFAFGLLAGVSSCAALVGGIILSISKQWANLYPAKNSTMLKLQPHILFNSGRIISYAFFGALLGLLGSRLQFSLRFSSLMVVFVSFIMIFLALQMLGFKAFRKFQFSLPRSATRYIANESNFKGKHMPFVMGALTFFLPCGFTITAQGLALLSGSSIQGALIMTFFALGTMPVLFLIGLSAVKFSEKPHIAATFSKVAGILVLFFAFFNINNQMNVLGFTGFGDIFKNGTLTSYTNNDKDLAPIQNGQQVIKMTASTYGYSPNYFKVRMGVPVRWEISDTGTSGCTNAVVSQGLFSGEVELTPGKVSIKEFTPQTPGRYKFSCWMGMISGVIEVVDRSSSSANSLINTATAATSGANNVDNAIPSGAKGCGCGGGGSGGSCGAQ